MYIYLLLPPMHGRSYAWFSGIRSLDGEWAMVVELVDDEVMHMSVALIMHFILF